MVFLKWFVITVTAVVAMVLAAGQAGLFVGAAPTDLGVQAGKFKPPSATANSVTSQARLYPNAPQHLAAQIAPIALRGSGPSTMARIKSIVLSMSGAKIVKSDDDYLYAQFTTPWLKFVDDVEFWFDPVSEVVQMRSASRVGQGDAGLNRKRIESVRAALAKSP